MSERWREVAKEVALVMSKHKLTVGETDMVLKSLVAFHIGAYSPNLAHANAFLASLAALVAHHWDDKQVADARAGTIANMALAKAAQQAAGKAPR